MRRISLHVAALGESLNVMKYLIKEKSADFNVKDDEGGTPLHHAAFSRNLDVVRYLIEEKC
ncbi:MAG: ankyrin repeat domain-containing protein [Wolbachia sp.]